VVIIQWLVDSSRHEAALILEQYRRAKATLVTRESVCQYWLSVKIGIARTVGRQTSSSTLRRVGIQKRQDLWVSRSCSRRLAEDEIGLLGEIQQFSAIGGRGIRGCCEARVHVIRRRKDVFPQRWALKPPTALWPATSADVVDQAGLLRDGTDQMDHFDGRIVIDGQRRRHRRFAFGLVHWISSTVTWNPPGG